MATFPGSGGSVTQAALDALNVVTQNAITGDLEVDGSAIALLASVTWAELQAIPKVAANNGVTKLVSDVGIHGSYWRYVHALSDWFAVSEIYLGSMQTDLVHGAPLSTHESAISVQILNDGTKSIWQNRDTLRVRGRFMKTGTTDSIRNAPYLNTSNAVGGVNARDGTASGFATPGATLIEVLEEVEIQRLSATTIRFISQVKAVAGENTTATSATNLPVTIDLAAASPAINLDTTSAVWLILEYWLTGTTDSAFTCFDANVVLVPRGI